MSWSFGSGRTRLIASLLGASLALGAGAAGLRLSNSRATTPSVVQSRGPVEAPTPLVERDGGACCGLTSAVVTHSASRILMRAQAARTTLNYLALLSKLQTSHRQIDLIVRAASGHVLLRMDVDRAGRLSGWVEPSLLSQRARNGRP
jgi:hypothetical protein